MPLKKFFFIIFTILKNEINKNEHSINILSNRSNNKKNSSIELFWKETVVSISHFHSGLMIQSLMIFLSLSKLVKDEEMILFI